MELNKQCELCGQKTEHYDVYQCAVHGRCSLSRRVKAGETLKACTSCPDFVPLANVIHTPKPTGTLKVCLVAPALWELGGIERWLVAMARYLPMVSAGRVTVDSVLIQFPHMVGEEIRSELSQFTRVLLWGDTAEAKRTAKAALQESDIAVISGMGDATWCLTGYNRPAVWLSHSCCEWSERFCRTAQQTGLVTHWASVGHLAKAVFPDDLVPQVTAIENGAEIERCTPIRGREWQRQQWGIADDQSIIGYIGRLSDDKRPQALADAVAHLPDEFIGIAVGDGQHKESVIEYSRVVAGDRVKFVGRMNHLGDAMAGMDFGLIASPAEGFCLSRVEMQLAGLPIVSTPTGEIPRLEHEIGPITVPIPIGATGPEIARAILDAHANPLQTRSIAQRARQLAWDRYTSAAMAGRWIDYLDHVTRK